MVFFPFWSGWEYFQRIDPGLGLVGDSYNIINSAASSIALGAIVFAIFIQNRQLRIQRDALEKQEEYLKKEDTWQRLKLKYETIPEAIEYWLDEMEFLLRTKDQLLDKIQLNRNFHKTKSDSEDFAQKLEDVRADIELFMNEPSSPEMKRLEQRYTDLLEISQAASGLKEKWLVESERDPTKLIEDILTPDEQNRFSKALGGPQELESNRLDIEKEQERIKHRSEKALRELEKIIAYKEKIDEQWKERGEILEKLIATPEKGI